MKGVIKAVCISRERGTAKQPQACCRLIENHGLENDAHAGSWHRQVSLLSYEKVEAFRQRGACVADGAFGENLLVSGIDFAKLPVGTKMAVGEALLEVTQIGKQCHHGCSIYSQVGDCIMPREGIFARVLHGGTVKPGDMLTVTQLPVKWRAAVIVLSDSAAAGQREDQSGPLAARLLQENGYEIREQIVLPDDPKALQEALIRIADTNSADLVITSGGTGFSQRDRTPEATMAVAQRNAPGIAEAIRAYSMTITKRAMLSRGVSVIRGQTLIINLPGSPKAVQEGLEYILDSLEHALGILTGKEHNCAENQKSI